MAWKVQITVKVYKTLRKLPVNVNDRFRALMEDIKKQGPIRGNWPNFSELEKNKYHCHLKKGSPTYVAVWEKIDDDIRIVEVIYVGTHEKAPY